MAKSGKGKTDKDGKEKDKDKKKNTSLRLEGKTLKALKKRAIDEDTSVQAIVENLVELYLTKKITINKTAK